VFLGWLQLVSTSDSGQLSESAVPSPARFVIAQRTRFARALYWSFPCMVEEDFVKLRAAVFELPLLTVCYCWNGMTAELYINLP
jgi:hypothetical protein